jgi:Leucine-rich repeat (LRR) protein
MAAKGGEKEGGGEEEEEEEEAAVNETQDHHHAAMPMPLCLIGEGLRSIPLLNSAALTCLSLHGNKISSFVGLEAATGLRELNLSSNELTASSLSSSGACLSPLVNLEELNLSANRLESVAELPLLPSLKHLRLAHNRLKSLTGISAAAGTTLISLDVRDNDIMHPLSRYHDSSALVSSSSRKRRWAQPAD